MGTAEIDSGHKQLIIRSHIITYGDAADEMITESIREEIETMWNGPKASLMFEVRTDNPLRLGLARRTPLQKLQVIFNITAEFRPGISPEEIYQDTNPHNNFFRIEEYAHGNISFVDGIGSNSGYFKLENLYKGSTTAAHEYGHTIGLEHPDNLDIRGYGSPGIMYPRGTLVDPQYQYDPSKPAGVTGGTMHPIYRKVLEKDIQSLKLHLLLYNQNNVSIVGDFTNIYHNKHKP